MKIPIDNDWRYVNEFMQYAKSEFGPKVSEGLQEKANEIATKSNRDNSRTWECPRCGNIRGHSEAAAVVKYLDLETDLNVLQQSTLCSECHDEFLEWLNEEGYDS